MEGTAPYTPIIPYLNKALPNAPFSMIDVGCGLGLDDVWRRFGPRLRAIGVDPNQAEIERLRQAETDPNVSYVAAFAGLPEGHPLLVKKAGKSDWPRNPWARLSAAKTLEDMRLTQLNNQEQTAVNLWGYMDLTKIPTIVLPDYLREHNVNDVDFIKIDVDGKDWDILNSLDAALPDLNVLAMGLEVSYFGSGDDTDNTFHNTDRFMKSHGFELFSLTLRRFSVAALPSRYTLGIPAQTEYGRIQQGDAIYVRDIAAAEHRSYGSTLSPEKLANLIALYAAFNLPDCAAEIVIEYRDKLEALNPDAMLDLLTEQALDGKKMPYAELIRRFEASDKLFWPNR